MSAQDTIKEALNLQQEMTQFNGKPIKDLTDKVLPPRMAAEEYQKIVDSADTLKIGIFLAQVLDGVKNAESLKDMQYWGNLAREIAVATLKSTKFEVTIPWIDKVLGQLEKERKDLPQWNNPTYIGQLADSLDATRAKIQAKVDKAKGK